MFIHFDQTIENKCCQNRINTRKMDLFFWQTREILPIRVANQKTEEQDSLHKILAAILFRGMPVALPR